MSKNSFTKLNLETIDGICKILMFLTICVFLFEYYIISKRSFEDDSILTNFNVFIFYFELVFFVFAFYFVVFYNVKKIQIKILRYLYTIFVVLITIIFPILAVVNEDFHSKFIEFLIGFLPLKFIIDFSPLIPFIILFIFILMILVFKLLDKALLSFLKKFK